MSGVLMMMRASLRSFFIAAIVILPGRMAFAAIDIQKVVSPGGIEAWLVQDKTLPVISMRFNFDAGSSYDPPDKPGLAVMLSGMLTKGAGELDEEAFQQLLQNRSIDLDFNVYSDNFYGDLSTLSPRKDEAFALLRDALNAPRFDAQPFQRLKEQITASIKRNRGQSNWIAGQFFDRLVYGDGPYAHDQLGTPESVAAFTADDLRGYLNDNLTRDTLLVTVVGDIDAKTLAKALDDVFGGLPAKANHPDLPHSKVPSEARTVVVEQELPQTIVRIGQQGIARNDPDWFAASIANYILGGGGFQSRLMKEARVKRGLTYGVYSTLRPGVLVNLMAIGGSTKNATAGEFLQVIRDELKRFAEEGPTDEEIKDAKGYLIGSFALQMTSTGDIAEVLMAIREYDLGIDYINRRSAEIEAVTREDVMRAMKRLLTPDALRVVVVGQPEGIEADRVVPKDADMLEALAREPAGPS
jgi:zinc protease